MREQTPCVVVTFHTTADAIAMENACKTRHIEGRLIPAPRLITADCGIAWSSPAEEREAVRQTVQEEKIEPAGIYEMMR